MKERQSCPYCMKGFITAEICTNCKKKVPDEGYPLAPGTVLNNRFRIVQAMGSGGFGITYRAWDQLGKCWAAVKELFPVSCVSRSWDSPEVRIREDKREFFDYSFRNFVKEAKTIYSLRGHAEIPEIYKCFTQFGTAYYAMEFLDGQDIGTYLRSQGRLTWNQLAEPAYDVLETIRILHSRNLIHRDISPDNIILLKSGRAKLIDFGSVRDYVSADHFTTVIKESFAPPELFRSHENQDPRTDIYLFCGTLYYLLSAGKLPKSAYARSYSLHNDGYDCLVHLSNYSPEAPDYVLEAIEHGLALKKEQRFESVDQLEAALFPSGYPTPRPAQRPIPYPAAQPGLKIVCMRGSMQGRTFPLPARKYVTLGQGIHNDIAFPEGTRGVSHKQCLLYVDEHQRIYIQDTQSRYGTFINRQRIQPNVWHLISPHQPVTVGNEEFQII